MKHPVQKLEKKDGTIKFVENEIVSLLLQTSSIDLNVIYSLVQKGKFSEEDYAQLMQLIGYSFSGYSELNCSRSNWNEVKLNYDELLKGVR